MSTWREEAHQIGWTASVLRDFGFRGFVPFADLPLSSVPAGPGVYAVLRLGSERPVFRPASIAGWFKGKDPSVTEDKLSAAWVEGAEVLYIGKAAAGASKRRGLRKRLDEYRKHGSGLPVGHWGGRYLWQLVDSDELLVAWFETPLDDSESLEAALLENFTQTFGARPFANRKMGTSS